MKIEINLLPLSYFKKRRIKRLVILATSLGTVVIAFFVGIYMLKIIELRSVNKKIEDVLKEENKYKDILVKVEALEKRKKEVEAREGTMKIYIDKQTKWPKFMTNLINAVPSTIRFTSISNKRSGNTRNFLISGVAVSKISVELFLKRLEKVFPNAGNIIPVRIIDSKNGGLESVSFAISFSIEL